MSEEKQDILALLSAPFDPEEVKFKPSVVSGNRALALAYVDARVIQDRLDEVLGVDGWQDDYNVLPDGGVVCKLSIKINGAWIVKMDVGSPSEQPDGGDRMKAAFSDALKRSAVKFGVGRFLYRLPQQWVDYDPSKRRFVREPKLPANLYSPVVKIDEKRNALAVEEPAKTWTEPRIDDKQAKQLDDMIRDKKASLKRFLELVSENTKQTVTSLAEVPVSAFDRSIAWLNNVKARTE